MSRLGLDHILNSPATSSSVDDQPPSPSSSTELTTVDSYYDLKPEVPEHREHPHCPSSLHCLRDTDGRPPHTLPVILRCTILGSPNKKLTIREIYAAMEAKYSWYKTAGSAWKQSVRHHLSLNLLFEREPRPVTDPGVGSYWTVNLNAPPGTKRPRKRGKKDSVDETEVAPPPRKRGRPRKYPEQEPMVFDQPKVTFDQPMSTMFVDRCTSGYQLPTWSTREESTKTSGGESSNDEDEPLDGDNFDKMSDDGYESEEDQERRPKYLLRPVNNDAGSRQHLQQQNSHEYTYPTRPSEPNMSALWNVHDEDSSDRMIERLRLEVEGLRQQSADAVSVSVKMSDQLAEAHAEASRTRAALRALETKYEEAQKRRKEAERMAEQESKLRLAAEETLRAMDCRRESRLVM